MEVMIYTSDPDMVDPKEVYDTLAKTWFVMTVNVNDGERIYRNPDIDHEESTDPAETYTGPTYPEYGD